MTELTADNLANRIMLMILMIGGFSFIARQTSGSVDDVSEDSLLFKISSTIGMINAVFAKIGKPAEGSGSFMSKRCYAYR